MNDEAWGHHIARYQAALRAGDYPKGTVYLRGYHLRRFARTVGVPLPDVTRDHIITFLDTPTWAANYRRSFRVTLRHFFRWARREKLTIRKPMKRIESITAPIGEPRPAPEDAVRRGQCYHDKRVPLMVRLGAQVGLRCCEICRVHRRDVIVTPGGYRIRVLGKGNKIRVLPLPRALAYELLDHPDGFIFPGRIDGHLSASYVSKLISRALPDQWTAHPLRHRFAGQAFIGSGKDIRVVQALLGHASVATTQIYTPVDDDLMRQAVEYAA